MATAPTRRRRIRILAALGVVVAAGLVVVLLAAGRDGDDPAAATPSAPPPPGTLLAAEPLAGGLPAGAEGWRIRYTSRDPRNGTPVEVTGVVVAPAGAAERRPVVAWAHGSLGIRPACAPSEGADPLVGFPGADEVLDRGWMIVATDYPGLGTPGPHPYLVGDPEGRAVLDAVRAVRSARSPAPADGRTVVWGHSQGGHAALFAGQIAPGYAADVPLAGVAALAPPTDLAAMLPRVQRYSAGRLFTAQAVRAWSEYYPELSFEDAIDDALEGRAAGIAEACLATPAGALALVGAGLLPQNMLEIDPASDAAWAERLAENTPDDPVSAPLLVAQGGSDETIPADITRRQVAARCARGEPVTYTEYPGADHLGVLVAARADLMAWTAARLAGEPAGARCP